MSAILRSGCDRPADIICVDMGLEHLHDTTNTVLKYAESQQSTGEWGFIPHSGEQFSALSYALLPDQSYAIAACHTHMSLMIALASVGHRTCLQAPTF